MKEYRRRPTATVVAIQMNLQMTGLLYEKWGGLQVGKPGDWLVQNGVEVYTVDKDSFAKTYTTAGPVGHFAKTGAVWAMEADTDGKIKTKEGYSDYKHGDMLVWNDPYKSDGYCMSQEKFFELYETEGSAIA